MKNNIRIKIVGTIFGSTGYDMHTRSLANALEKQEGIEIVLEVPRPHDWVTKVNDNELKMLNRDASEYDLLLLVTLPHAAPYFLCEDKPIIQYCVWEGNKIPKSWVNKFTNDNIKQIWCPSNHTKNAIENTTEDEIIKNKIKIIPHGIDLDLFKVDKSLKSNKFTFIANKGYKGLNDRGGLQYLWKAFAEEFKEDEEVELLCKINPAYGLPNISEDFKKLGIKHQGIKLSVENISINNLYKLYNKGNVFVTTSQAESFNIPCLEAMACGLPVIATEFGGQSDYVNDNNGWLIKGGELREVTWDLQYEGISWNKPSISAIRTVLRHVFENKDKIVSKSEKAIETAKNMTWNKSAEIGKKYIKEIIKNKVF